MAWIESHEHLEKNGRLLKLADILGINKYQAIGHLHAFWWWATHNAGRDGDLSQCDPTTIAAASGWQTYVNEKIMDRNRGHGEVPDAYAFCHAMVDVGFIDGTHMLNNDNSEPLGDGAKIHQWKKYSARYFDWIESIENRRESERIRQRRRRENIRKMSRTIERDSTRPNLTKPNLTKPNHTLNTLSPNGEMFTCFWKLYPKKKNRGDAEKAWKQIKPDKSLFEKITIAVAAQIETDQWKKDNGQFIPYPGTWLRAKAWEDEIQQTVTKVLL